MNLKITIDRDGLTPHGLDGAELGHFIVAVCTFVRTAAPGDNAWLALDGIEANCISLHFRTNSRRVVRAYALLVMGIAAGVLRCSSDCETSIRDINRFCTRNGVTVSLPRNGRRAERVQIGGGRAIPLPEVHTMKDYAIVYGKLIDVGGSDPNVHLDVDGQRVTCHVTHDQARQLAPRLYETVGVEGDSVRDETTGRIITMRVTGILPYYNRPGEDPFEGLRALERQHRSYAGVDPAVWLRELRGETV